MSPRYSLPTLLGLFVVFLAACSDNPTSPSRGKSPLYSLPDSVPHDFVVTTDPLPVVPGEAFEVVVRWTDANMNMSSIGMEMEGGLVISGWTVSRDPDLSQYVCSQRMMAPAAFHTNLLFIHVGDPDSSIIHTYEVEIEGGFEPPENTPPYDFRTNFHPKRITAEQTVSLDLNGHDDENNMTAGMTVTYADGTPVVPHPDTARFLFNADARVFSYRVDFTAPGEPGIYELDFTVGDREGETYEWSATFEVEGPNQAPYFTEIWLEDRVLDGNSDVLHFRVAAIDPDGDELLLLSQTIHGSMEYDVYGAAAGDTTVWTGIMIPGSADTSRITFRLYDGNVEISSDPYDVVVDHSGRPILDQYLVTDGSGVTRTYDPTRNAYLEAEPGEAFVFELVAHDPQGDELTYEWFVYVDGYRRQAASDEPVFGYSMPIRASQVDVFCQVTDPDGNVIGLRPTIISVY